MESFIQKYGWALNFGLIAAFTLLTALLINGFISAQLSQYTVPKMPPLDEMDRDRPQLPTDDGERDRWVDQLADRCLFGCPEEIDPDECLEECEEGEVCEYGECVPEELEDEEEFFDDVPRLTELELKLMGVVATANPRYSMAMILDESEGETHVVGLGDILPGEVEIEILEIRRDRVFIDNEGRLEFIRLEDSPYGDPDDTRSARREDGATSGEEEPAAEGGRRGIARSRAQQRRERAQEQEESGDSSGVVRSGDNEFSIDRSRIESELSNPEQLTRQARIMPNYRDGEPDGLRLVGVTSDSLYSDLGIRSGDVIHAVDGNPITSQQQAMSMLESMQNQGQVTIEIERRGQRQQMQYNIQ